MMLEKQVPASKVAGPVQQFPAALEFQTVEDWLCWAAAQLVLYFNMCFNS